ncbi:hypothetical protein JCM10908_002910 [Rhodotorula pacifica]|uniref:uncharacterized protein n=1 Tax=Rhodotorula pacifica TaxID=1495444 RepID=UPI0031714A9B
MGGASIPLDRAIYCASPDAVAECIKLCPAAEVVSIGVRIGTYLQCGAYFVLVLFAPDEGGAESMWLGLSVSFSFLAACYVQLYLGTITLHHTVIVALLSHLPYISTLAGMNSLTSYEVLGPAGVLFLQAGMIVKSLFTLLLWALCLFAFFVGQLPHWTGLAFRQANCFTSTSLVVWLVPVRPGSASDGKGSSALDLVLILSYTFFWFLVLAIGSYWTLIAPYVLVKRGGHLRDPHKKKIKGFPVGVGNEPKKLLQRLEGEDRAFAHSRRRDEPDSSESDQEDFGDPSNSRGEKHWQGHPGGYQRDPDYDSLNLMTMRSLSKSGSVRSTSSLPSYRTGPSTSAGATGTGTPREDQALATSSDNDEHTLSDSGQSHTSDNVDDPKSAVTPTPVPPRSGSPPPATRGMTALSPWSKGLRGTKRDAASRWTRRQIQSRHHFIIWPLVAVLLIFTIVTIEVQMVANDVYSGEELLDFPGALTLFLAIPTVWAVLKALKRIQEGRRPTPTERADQTFWELAKEKEQRRRRRRERELARAHSGRRGRRRGGYAPASEEEWSR